jgi:hypothetical protein
MTTALGKHPTHIHAVPIAHSTIARDNAIAHRTQNILANQIHPKTNAIASIARERASIIRRSSFERSVIVVAIVDTVRRRRRRRRSRE